MLRGFAGPVALAVAVALAGMVSSPASAAGGWVNQAVPLPGHARHGSLAGVSCATSASCTAVGYYQHDYVTVPLAEQWEGTAWAPQPVPTAAGLVYGALAAVSCTAAASCTAVGYQDFHFEGQNRPLAEHWNGTAWAIQPAPRPAHFWAQLRAISCPAPDDCIAVGDSNPTNGDNIALTLAEHWNGQSWAIQPTPDPAGRADEALNILSGVSCVSATSCTAVGMQETPGQSTATLAEHWNGRTWAVQSTPNSSAATSGDDLTAVSCPSPVSCTAVGNGSAGGPPPLPPLIEHWNGRTWTIQPAPDPGLNLDAITCTSPAWCTAVGGNPAEVWNGHTWTIQRTASPRGKRLTAISCTAPGTCTAVGPDVPSSPPPRSKPIAEHE